MNNSKSSRDENHVYYDMSLYNNSTQPVIASMYENRSVPLIENPNNYHLSCVRFLIPTSYVPIFRWPKLPNGQPNNAYYSVTIRRAGVDYQQFLQFVPYNNVLIADPTYFFVYSYQQFLDAINEAFRLAFVAAAGTATSHPYMVLNQATGLISLYAEFAYANALGEYEIYMNNDLYHFFDNFKVTRNGFSPSITNGKNVMLWIQNNGNNTVAGLTLAIDSYAMQQEYDSLFLFNEARRIILVSNSIPVQSEAVNVQNSSNLTSGNSYNKFITDFEFNIQSGLSNNTLRSYVQYSTIGEYRLLNMQSNTPLYTFDVQIAIEFADQTVIPLYILPNEFISVKLMFRSKKFKSGL